MKASRFSEAQKAFAPMVSRWRILGARPGIGQAQALQRSTTTLSDRPRRNLTVVQRLVSLQACSRSVSRRLRIGVLVAATSATRIRSAPSCQFGVGLLWLADRDRSK
jgi:hypothetical protein